MDAAKLEAERKLLEDGAAALNGIALEAINDVWRKLTAATKTPQTLEALAAVNSFIANWNREGKRYRDQINAIKAMIASLPPPPTPPPAPPPPPKIVPPEGITADDGDVWRLTAQGATRNGVLMKWGRLKALWYGTPTGKSTKELWPQGDSSSWYLVNSRGELVGPYGAPPTGEHQMLLAASSNPIKFPPIAPPPPVVLGDDPGRFVVFAENYANEEMAHAQLYEPWVNLGGDYLDANGVQQGSSHYATTNLTASGQLLTWTVTAAVARHLSAPDMNTGFYVSNLTSATGPTCWARTGTVPPKLHVTTTTGTIILDAIGDCFLVHGDASTGDENFFNLPACLLFDYETLTGTLLSAELKIHVVTGYFGPNPQQIAADVLDMPLLIDNPSVQGYTVVEGLASQSADEDELAGDVLVYTDTADLPTIQQTFYVNPAFNYISLSAGGREFGTWDDLGISFLRAWARADGDIVPDNPAGEQPYGGTPQILRADRWFQDTNSSSGPPGASWKRPWASGQSLGYDEMYLRFFIELGTDVRHGHKELGIKLFTTNGRYEWGAFQGSIPALADAEKFEYMLWIGPAAVGNPGVYKLASYDYDVGHSFALFPSNGDIRPTEACLREGRRYTLEQYVKLNTIVGGVPQSNGIHKIFLDGCLVYSDTTRKIRNLPHVQIQGTQAQLYHGGLGKPSQKFHIDVGGIAVNQSYIGPRVNSAIDNTTTPPTLLPVHDGVTDEILNYSAPEKFRWTQVEDSALVQLVGSVPGLNPSALGNVINSWGGGAWDKLSGKVHVHGAAHGGSGNEPGTYFVNIRTGRVGVTVAPIYMTAPEQAYLDWIQKYEYVMHRPTEWLPNHTYTDTEFLWAPALPFGYRQPRVFPTTKNGFLYTKTDGTAIPKTSGATEPIWPTTLGQTVVDGQITWRCDVNNNPFSGNWNSGMPPDYCTLPVVGSTTLVPEPVPGVAAPNAVSSGKQFAFHCWDKWRWIPWMNRIFMCVMKMQFLNPDTGVLTFGQNYNDTNDQTCVVDEVTERIYGFTMEASAASTRWRQYNPETDTFEANHDMDLNPSTQYNLSGYPGWFQRGREIFILKRTAPQGFFAFHIDNAFNQSGQKWRAIPMSENIIYRPGKNTEFRMEYIPELDLGVGVFPDGYMFSIDPDTGEVEQPASFVQGSLTVPIDPGEVNGAYGKLNYMTDKKILTFICSAHQNLMIMRMAD